MTRVIIMAQGKGSRWEGPELPSEYKQLIPILGKPLVGRTINQLQAKNFRDIWLASLTEPFAGLGVDKFYAQREHDIGSIIQGIIRVRHLWMNQTDVLFILGDVMFSYYDLNIIVSTLETSIFGREGPNIITGKAAKEIFAVRFVGNKEHMSWIYGNLTMLAASTSEPHKLKLWDWYNSLKQFGQTDKVKFVSLGETYTDDIDSPQHYQQFFAKMQEEAAKENEARNEGAVEAPEQAGNEE